MNSDGKDLDKIANGNEEKNNITSSEICNPNKTNQEIDTNPDEPGNVAALMNHSMCSFFIILINIFVNLYIFELKL